MGALAALVEMSEEVYDGPFVVGGREAANDLVAGVLGFTGDVGNRFAAAVVVLGGMPRCGRAVPTRTAGLHWRLFRANLRVALRAPDILARRVSRKASPGSGGGVPRPRREGRARRAGRGIGGELRAEGQDDVRAHAATSPGVTSTRFRPSPVSTTLTAPARAMISALIDPGPPDWRPSEPRAR